MNEILNANKWLMGRIRHVYKEDKNTDSKTSKNNPKKVLALCVSDDEIPQKYINEVINDELFKNTENPSYTHYTEIIKRFDLGSAGKSFNNDNGKLFEFGIISDKQQTHFCIYICISHMIADGHTIFQIYKQLDFENIQVFSMNAERIENYDALINLTSLPPQGLECPEAFIKFFELSMLPTFSKGFAQKFKGKRLKQFLYKFDKEEIKRRKEEAKVECEQLGLKYVSTNDVIMAWFAGLVNNNKCDNVLMPLNTRNRIQQIDSNRAGMYLALPILRKEHLASPAQVRKHLEGMSRPDKSYKWELPNKSDIKRFIGGSVTNWTSFYHHVEPSGFQQVLHFPVEAEMNGNGGGPFFGQEQDMVIFQADKETIGCLIWGKRDELCKELLESDKMLAEKLCDI